jgi:hypothetical protein
MTSSLCSAHVPHLLAPLSLTQSASQGVVAVGPSQPEHNKVPRLGVTLSFHYAMPAFSPPSTNMVITTLSVGETESPSHVSIASQLVLLYCIEVKRYFGTPAIQLKSQSISHLNNTLYLAPWFLSPLSPLYFISFLPFNLHSCYLVQHLNLRAVHIKYLCKIFSWYYRVPSGRTLDVPGVHSASNRNEYQEYHRGKGGRRVRLTILPPSCPDCLEILGAWISWSPKGFSRPVVGYFQFLILYTLRSVGAAILLSPLCAFMAR